MRPKADIVEISLLMNDESSVLYCRHPSEYIQRTAQCQLLGSSKPVNESGKTIIQKKHLNVFHCPAGNGTNLNDTSSRSRIAPPGSLKQRLEKRAGWPVSKRHLCD